MPKSVMISFYHPTPIVGHGSYQTDPSQFKKRERCPPRGHIAAGHRGVGGGRGWQPGKQNYSWRPMTPQLLASGCIESQNLRVQGTLRTPWRWEETVKDAFFSDE